MQIKRGKGGGRNATVLKLCVLISIFWPIGSHSYKKRKGLVKPPKENKQMHTEMQPTVC